MTLLAQVLSADVVLHPKGRIPISYTNAIPSAEGFTLFLNGGVRVNTSSNINITYGSPDMYGYTNANDIISYHMHKTFTVTLTTTHGTLTLQRVSQALTFIKGAGFQDITVSFSGPLQDVNAALRGLQYKPDLNWNSVPVRGAVGDVDRY
jgi:hypothetical protein